ncbi:MAG: hypothetical protein ACOYI7_06615 [Candidatus Excrementavichristensenella sp.]|jgi:hypothetical protein
MKKLFALLLGLLLLVPACAFAENGLVVSDPVVTMAGQVLDLTGLSIAAGYAQGEEYTGIRLALVAKGETLAEALLGLTETGLVGTVVGMSDYYSVDYETLGAMAGFDASQMFPQEGPPEGVDLSEEAMMEIMGIFQAGMTASDESTNFRLTGDDLAKILDILQAEMPGQAEEMEQAALLTSMIDTVEGHVTNADPMEVYAVLTLKNGVGSFGFKGTMSQADALALNGSVFMDAGGEQLPLFDLNMAYSEGASFSFDLTSTEAFESFAGADMALNIAWSEEGFTLHFGSGAESFDLSVKPGEDSVAIDLGANFVGQAFALSFKVAPCDMGSDWVPANVGETIDILGMDDAANEKAMTELNNISMGVMGKLMTAFPDLMAVMG